MLAPHAADPLRHVRAGAARALRTESLPVTASSSRPTRSSSRTIVQADALAWMRDNAATREMSVITSLPDVSELGELDLNEWQEWFTNAARDVIQWINKDGAVAIFYQSDIRDRGRWIDKSYLVMRAIEDTGASLLWHKIVCRKPPGSIALGRPSFSHMLCVVRGREPRATLRSPGPDVIANPGASTWSKGMGVNACRVACGFLRDEVQTTRIVVDPFCGRGSVLAVANEMGFDALGVDISAKRCRAAKRALVPE